MNVTEKYTELIKKIDSILVASKLIGIECTEIKSDEMDLFQINNKNYNSDSVVMSINKTTFQFFALKIKNGESIGEINFNFKSEYDKMMNAIDEIMVFLY